MLANVTEYHKPTNVDEALRLLRRRSVRTVPLAGGTALLARRDTTIQAVVDLSALGLDYVRRQTNGIEIGAMTTLQALVTSPVLQSYAGGLLATAAHDTATRTIRNTATVGGSIMACGPSTDIVVALLALGAIVLPAQGDSRPLGDVLSGAHSPKLITAVRLPLDMEGWASALCRVARLPSDQAIINVACVLHIEDGICRDIRLAAGGVASTPVRLDAAKHVLRGERLNDAGIQAAMLAAQEQVHPPTDVLGSSEYRRAMLGVLVRRAVEQCQSRRMDA